jgi:hypothetical protein
MAMLATGSTLQATADSIGCHPDSVRKWALSSNALETRHLAKEAVKSAIENALSPLSLKVRERLAEVMGKQAESLAGADHSVSEMRTNPDRQGLAAVTKTVAETASMVFGWDAETSTSDQMSTLQVIDCASEVTTETPGIVDGSVNKTDVPPD